MTIDELGMILKENEIDEGCYQILNETHNRGEIVIFIDTINKGYRVWITERGKMFSQEFFLDEDSACKYFLRNLGIDFPVLKKYLTN